MKPGISSRPRWSSRCQSSPGRRSACTPAMRPSLDQQPVVGPPAHAAARRCRPRPGSAVKSSRSPRSAIMAAGARHGACRSCHRRPACGGAVGARRAARSTMHAILSALCSPEPAHSGRPHDTVRVATASRFRQQPSTAHETTPHPLLPPRRGHRVADAAPTRTVLDWLREDARCTGTKEGCAEGDCGACTVVVGELAGEPARGRAALQPVNACIQFLPTLDGKALFTVEDLAASRRRAAPGAAGDGRLPRLAVRLLHAGLRDVAVGLLRAPPRRRHAARRASSSPTTCRATCAAAPATGRSSMPAQRMFELPAPAPRPRRAGRRAAAALRAMPPLHYALTRRRGGLPRAAHAGRPGRAARRRSRRPGCSPAAPTSACG